MSAFLNFLVKWRKSSGNRLFDLLVTAAKPVKSMPDRRAMLEAEEAQVEISFGDVRTLAISGDSLDKILVKSDGSCSSEENADASIFHDGDQPPLHLVECKYRILPGGGSTKGLGAKALLDKVNGQIQKTRMFLVGEKYCPADGGFLVTNHDVAETLYDVIENERSGGASYDFDVGNTEELKSWLLMRGVRL